MQILAGVQGALLMGRLTGDPHVIDTVAGEVSASTFLIVVSDMVTSDLGIALI